MKDTATPKRRFWLGGKREPAQDTFFREALDEAQWAPGDESGWDSCWYTGMPRPEVFERLAPGKFVNHIPGNNALTVKSRLYETLHSARKRMIEQEGPASPEVERLSFYPRTFVMPQDYHALQRAAAANPRKRWIRKPKNSARGKGIEVVRDIGTVPVGDRWMVQEYLDNPHTIDGHKYVLRLYVLISSVVPLRAYWFREGSCKLASAVYDLDDLANPYSHLTNPDVNATNVDSDTPVVFLSLATYRAWLREQGHDDANLFRRLQDLVTLTVIASRETLVKRTRAVKADTSGCYELLGLDCLVDDTLRPWILECNLSPSLEVCAAPQDGGDVEAAMKRALVADMVSLVGMNRPTRETRDADPEARIRAEADAELARAGGYERIYPPAEVERYLPFFPLPRLEDMVLADAVNGSPVPRPRLRANGTEEIISDQSLALYREADGVLYSPTPAAAWVWLNATGGADPDDIGRQLAAAREQAGQGSGPALEWESRREVWDMLAEWAEAGLLRQTGAADPARAYGAADADPDAVAHGSAEVALQLDGNRLRVLLPLEAIAERVRRSLEPFVTTSSPGDDCPVLRVLESQRGYAVSSENWLLHSGLTLGQLVPALLRALLRAPGSSNQPGAVLGGIIVPLEDASTEITPAIMLVEGPAGIWDALAVALAEKMGSGHCRGVTPAGTDLDHVSSPGLPARIPQDLPDALSYLEPQADGQGCPTPVHTWGSDQHGYMLPASTHLRGKRFEVVAVIKPAAAPPDNEEAPVLQRASSQEILAGILPSSYAADGNPLGAETVLAFADWLERRALFNVSIADPQTALDEMLKLSASREPVT